MKFSGGLFGGLNEGTTWRHLPQIHVAPTVNIVIVGTRGGWSVREPSLQVFKQSKINLLYIESVYKSLLAVTPSRGPRS